MAIQQHPLPQDISNYRFRLIGDMTIKQFASLAISIIVAIIVYGLPLPFFFRYPLTFLFVILGVGMAFVPFQGRTLDVWIIAFIKSIYSPTLFSWKKTSIEDINADTVATSEANLHTSAPVVSNAVIEINKGNPTVTPQPINIPPADSALPSDTTPAPIQTPTSSAPSIQEVANPSVVIPPEINIVPEITKTSSNTNIIEDIKEIQPEIPNVTKSEETISSPTSPPATQALPTNNLPVPFTPTTPNTLVGLTISKDSRIIDGVLVEIKKNNLTIRATKSNKLGQFMFARPLENGTYQILAEKDGNTFITYSLDLTGEIIRPLKIQSQS